MPLVNVLRYAVTGGIPTDTAQQSGTGTLELPLSGTVEVAFDPTTWTGAQKNVAYTIFSFATITGNVATLQGVQADIDAIFGPGVATASFTQVGNTITVTFV